MRILIATDAWQPQVNGVVRSLESLSKALNEQGVEVDFLSPQGYATLPLPTYREIRLALVGWRSIKKRLDGQGFDHIHIATEGPIGFAVRRYCLETGHPFTTSFHTRFPEYIRERVPIPEWVSYGVLRRFHNAGNGLMVATPSLARELEQRGFNRPRIWSRGVDHQRFHPDRAVPLSLPRPIFLYAGRLAPEKNLSSFLGLDLPGSKLVIGDGPARAALQQAHPRAHFLGAMPSDELARYYAAADVFVFPSRTDTFGMVVLEALACGCPVAALPVQGPLDTIGTSGAGVLDFDLRTACIEALTIPRERARTHALTFTWANSARQFLDNIAAVYDHRGTAPIARPVARPNLRKKASKGAPAE
ncbi:glycosyltransferase family 4 protein [Beijerinckia indica]|uniref:Glycosyl transferase group 1 n=1 Tax=Beijerinckia indica subsp. indica (strain ATCC 9039 / DSM 1715 / NCIMB 8712) TaxID=395963 RepID=B2IBQ0_BEII9|nr:glycosyltransferase family 1 protein [Beijerinckia indica]ACB93772.1 glycosyl transferase group 1 [Beijerinckia indica subsp. indica ATCC 9039]